MLACFLNMLICKLFAFCGNFWGKENWVNLNKLIASLIPQLVKIPPAMQETPSLIPGSGRSAGEGIGYPLQYSWASLVAQLVKNPSAMQETWVQSLTWEDPLEKGKATHSSILAWRIPWAVHWVAKSRTQLRDFHFHSLSMVIVHIYWALGLCQTQWAIFCLYSLV